MMFLVSGNMWTVSTSTACKAHRASALSSTCFVRGNAVCSKAVSRAAVARQAPFVVSADGEEQKQDRFRLNNLGPEPGARRKAKRVGRGYGAGQGGSCGRGMRGQKSRSGASIRAGFEGGQMPLYRRLPKKRGIAGGMAAGKPKFVTVNLDDLNKFEGGEEVTLQALKEKKILNISGKDRKLPLKVLGDGQLTRALTINAVKFSSSAREKIEAAGGTLVEIPVRPKWTKALGKERKLAAAEAAAASTDEQRAAKKMAKGKQIKRSERIPRRILKLKGQNENKT